MIIDNWPVHPHIENLKIITLLIFLPKNIIPIRNSAEQGTIQGLKTKYCTIFAFHIIATLDNKKPINVSTFLKSCRCLLELGTRYQLILLSTAIRKGKSQNNHRMKLSVISTTHLMISKINLKDFKYRLFFTSWYYSRKLR